MFRARKLSEELNDDDSLRSIMLTRDESKCTPIDGVTNKFAPHPPLDELPEGVEPWVFLTRWHRDKLVNNSDRADSHKFEMEFEQFRDRCIEFEQRLDKLEGRVDGHDVQLKDHNNRISALEQQQINYNQVCIFIFFIF